MVFIPKRVQRSSVGGFTVGSIPYAASDGTLSEDNSNLFFQDANNRLGVGTNAPATTVHFVGTTAGGTVATFRSFDTGSDTILASYGRNDAAVEARLSYIDSDGSIRFGTFTAHPTILIANNEAWLRIVNATGISIGLTVGQQVGFYGVAPIAQRAGAAQAAVATTGATQTTPFGFTTAAQADAIVTLVNELRAWAVAQGFIKGAA